MREAGEPIEPIEPSEPRACEPSCYKKGTPGGSALLLSSLPGCTKLPVRRIKKNRLRRSDCAPELVRRPVPVPIPVPALVFARLGHCIVATISVLAAPFSHLPHPTICMIRVRSPVRRPRPRPHGFPDKIKSRILQACIPQYRVAREAEAGDQRCYDVQPRRRGHQTTSLGQLY